MEISIKWNICRLCLYEEQKNEQRTARKAISCILAEEMTAKQIFECSGVMVTNDDGLPDKICRKCLTILKYITKFRKACIESEKYLLMVIQRANSASTLFNVERVTTSESSYDVLRESFEVSGGGGGQQQEEEGERMDKLIAGDVREEVEVEQQHQEEEEVLLETDIGCEQEFILNESTVINRPAMDTHNNDGDDDVDSVDLKTKNDTSNGIKYSLKSRKKTSSTIDLGADLLSCMILGQITDVPEEHSEPDTSSYILAQDLPNDSIAQVHSQFDTTLLERRQLFMSGNTLEILEEEEEEEPLTTTNNSLDCNVLHTESLTTGTKLMNTSTDDQINGGGDDNLFILINDLKTNGNGEEVLNQVLEGEDLDYLPVMQEEEEEEVVDEEEMTVDTVDDDDGGGTAAINDDQVEANEEAAFLYKSMIAEEFLTTTTNNEEESESLQLSRKTEEEECLQEDQVAFENYEQGGDGTEDDYTVANYSVDDEVEAEEEELEDGKSGGPELMIMKSTVHRVGSKVTMEIGLKGSNELRQMRKDTNRMKASTKLSSSLYVCHICGNHFSNRQLMNGHLKVHRQEKSHECELCSKRFITSCNLQAHMRIHTGEKPYECKFCKRRFTDRSTHLRHERIHTNEKPFPCKECGKSFSLATTLQAHRKVHSGERPYKCLLCEKSFKLPHQLKAHKNSFLHKSVEQMGS